MRATGKGQKKVMKKKNDVLFCAIFPNWSSQPITKNQNTVKKQQQNSHVHAHTNTTHTHAHTHTQNEQDVLTAKGIFMFMISA